LSRVELDHEKDFNPADPYAQIRIDQNNVDNEDIQCDVCLDTEGDDGDEIIICDNCFGAVH